VRIMMRLALVVLCGFAGSLAAPGPVEVQSVAPASTQQRTILGKLTVAEVWVADGHTRLERIGDVSGVAETPLGTVWITNYSEILAVDPSDPSGASDVMITQREGDGPGELKSAHRIAITPDGNVAVHDSGRDAIEVYSDAGKPLRRVQLPFSVQWVKGFAILASAIRIRAAACLGSNQRSTASTQRASTSAVGPMARRPRNGWRAWSALAAQRTLWRTARFCTPGVRRTPSSATSSHPLATVNP